MSSTRLSQRFPPRPTAQHSPSPDVGTKSVIISTTPPKINKDHMVSRKDRDESIIKIREENKKLKEEMKSILGRTKRVEGGDETWVDVSRREDIKGDTEGSQIVPNESQIKRQGINRGNYVPVEVPSINVAAVKDQLNLLIREKEQRLHERIRDLEKKLELSQVKLKACQNRMDEQKRQELQTSIKRKINFDSSPIPRRVEDSSPLNITPIRLSPSSSHQQLVNQLSFQLSGAQSTIRRLETILETEQKSASSLKFQSDRKELVISQLKKEISDMRSADRDFSERKQSFERKDSTEKKELKLFYEKEINKLSVLVEELQDKLLGKEKEVRELERSRAELEIKLDRENGVLIQSLNNEIQNHKEEIRRLSEEVNSSIQAPAIRKESLERNNTNSEGLTRENEGELNQLLTEYQNQIKLSKVVISTLESELKRLEETHSECDGKIASIQSQNQRLMGDFNKVREELDEIGVINSRLTQQKNQMESLTSQLTQALKNLEVTKEEHREQNLSFVQEVKAIRSITQSIYIPEQDTSRTFNEHLNTELQSLSLKHRQETLKLQESIVSRQSQKQRLKVQVESLQRENSALKQQIESLNNSIKEYNKPIVSHKELSHEEIESIILKEEKKPNLNVESANRILGGVNNRLGRLYDEINRNGRE